MPVNAPRCSSYAERVPDMEEEARVNGFGLSPGRRESSWGQIALLDKTKEFFRTCDVEGKGFITRTDMRVREGACVCVCVCVCVREVEAGLRNYSYMHTFKDQERY